jgi:hypothetical protein
MCSNGVYKKKIINSRPFALLIINVNPLQYSKGIMHIWQKKNTFEKNKDYPFLRFECFEHAKTFFICVKF